MFEESLEDAGWGMLHSLHRLVSGTFVSEGRVGSRNPDHAALPQTKMLLLSTPGTALIFAA